MKTYLKFLFICIILLFLNSCSSSKKTSANKNSELESNLFFEGVFQDNSGIVYINNQKNIKKTLLAINSDFGHVDYKLSPDSKTIALSYFDSKKVETYLYSLNIKLQELILLKMEKGFYQINLFWDTDSTIISNFYATKQNPKSKLWNKYTGSTSIINIKNRKTQKSFTPIKVSVLESHIQNQYLVYSNSNSFYIINKANNKLVTPIKGFTTKNKHAQKLTFSPDGKHLIFLKRKTFKTIQGKTETLNALFLSDYSGKNRKELLSYKYNPKNISWTPNSKKIICDIASQKYSDLRRIAIYDTEEDRTQYSEAVIASEEAPFISPSGVYILYERKIPNQFNTTDNYYIVKSIIPEIRHEGYIKKNNSAISVEELGGVDYWIDDFNIVFCNSKFLSIVDWGKGKNLSIPSNKWILFLKRTGVNYD
ncbi:MAG: hypothetical protein L3J41_07080 [Melioribacteraceae bacterium]|nr:hypothetical protein [Melioribacteraceae bacterium]